jgi:hypothetical protein
MKKVLLTVFGLMSVLGLAAQWNVQEDLRVTEDEISGFDVQTNKDGITFVGFWDMVAEDPEKQGDRYSDGSDMAYLLQIIGKEGNKLFPDGGKLISHEPTRSFTAGRDQTIFTDRDGNILYMVKDERNASGTDAVDQGYFVYKISPTGDFLWDEPIDLDRGYAYNLPIGISVVELPDGTYVFVHTIYPTSTSQISYIAIDRVSRDGTTFLWDEPLLLQDNSVSYYSTSLLDAGNGNFILVYFRSGQLYAQKYDFNKEPVWSNATLIYRGGFPNLATQNLAVNVISDQKGGCFVGWYDDRANSQIEKAYVSHIESNGQQGFVTQEDGLRLSFNDLRSFRPSLCYDAAGEILYAAWEEHAPNAQRYRSIVVQKITKEGELLWTSLGEDDHELVGWLLDGVWSPEAPSYHSIQLAGEGKIAVFHQHDYNYDTENIITLLDVSGEQPQYIWPDERLVFSPKGGAKSDLLSLPLTDNDYFLTFWADNRTTDLSKGEAVFAQKVYLNLPTAIRFPETGLADNRFTVVSNGGSGKVDFVVDGSTAGDASLEIYSISGQKADLIRLQLHAGENRIPWNLQHLATGVYLAKLTTPAGVQTKRFVIN